MTEAGVNPTGFGEHYAQRGGATAAAAAGLGWLDLKRHGRWRSDKAAQTYVDTARDSTSEAASALARAASTSSSNNSVCVFATSSASESRSGSTSDYYVHTANGNGSGNENTNSTNTVHLIKKKTVAHFKMRSGRRESVKTQREKFRDEIQYEASLERRRIIRY